jgi:hypothetical protein
MSDAPDEEGWQVNCHVCGETHDTPGCPEVGSKHVSRKHGPIEVVRVYDTSTGLHVNFTDGNETYACQVATFHNLCESVKAGLSAPEPPPKANDSRPIWELVIEDMQERDDEGRRKYGVPLQAGNGRDPLIDAYQEALDLAVYLRQAIEERKL